MSATETCPQCGTKLDADRPQGLCPACLLRQAMNSQVTAAVPEGREDGLPFVPPTPQELSPFFPQLVIFELIGRGGMGAVYKARQRSLDRIIALKVLPPGVSRDPSFEERFTREARALARVNHPNIVNVYEFGQSAGGLFYFVMEFVDGVNLRQMIRTHQLAPAEALAIVPQICDALQYAHDEGIVHRDIKPENILVDRKGRVKIADFGLAKILSPKATDYTLTSPQMVMGTPHYMAPEQLEKPGTVDHRADIYSLGVVFYEMLTGELPLGRFEPPSHKITLDVRLDDVVLKTLEKEPQRRYQHASEVRTEVETIGRHQIAAPPPAPPPPAPVAVQDAVLAAAREQVRGPAAGLVVTSLLNWLAMFITLALFQYARANWGWRTPDGLVVLVATILTLGSGAMLFGALKMMRLESFGWAIAASILAMIIGPGYVIGWPVGIWSLVTLTRPEVRAAFRRRREAWRHAGAGGEATPPRVFLRPALWIVGLLSLVAFLSYNESHDGAQTRTTVGLFDPWFVSVTGQHTRIDLFSGSTLFALVALACGWFLARGGRKAAPAGSPATSASYTLHPDRRLSRTALVGAILAALPLLVMPAYLVPVSTHMIVVEESVQATPHGDAAATTQPEPVQQDAAHAEGGTVSPRPRMMIGMLVTLALGLAAPFATTILGVVAIGQIRASRGRLYGLPLAVADAVLYPLIVLDLLIGAFWYNILPDAASMNWPAVVILTVISCVVADVLIVRNCLRRARSPENWEV